MKNIQDTIGRSDRARQAIWIAIIILVGVLLAALILTGNASTGGAADHAVHDHAAESQGPAKVAGGHDDHGHAQRAKEPEANQPGQDAAEAQAQHEWKVAFTEAQIEAAGITMSMAGPARIQDTIQLPGEIVFNANRTAQLVPRLSGVVQAVHAELGQEVKQGDVLAAMASPELSARRSTLSAAQRRLALAQTTYARERTLWKEKVSAEQDYLQARQQLQEAQISVTDALEQLQALGADPGQPGSFNRLEVRAPFDGTIVEKSIALGETVAADARIFRVSDLSTVWADIMVPAEMLGAVRVGSDATVNATAFESQTQGTVSYVGALLGQRNRAATARVTLRNPDGAWRPGLFVNVHVSSSEAEVPVSVKPAAVHSLEEENVVFVRRDNEFVAHAVTIGRRDSRAVEILEGLEAGARYAVANSFVIKSELGKSSASHSH